MHRPISRVHYPDPKKEQQVTDAIRWGERCYYFNCHRAGGDLAWHRDNLATAEGAPAPEQITPAWTFAGRWDPGDRSPPALARATMTDGGVTLTWSEDVTVQGRPRVRLKSGATAVYASGSGSSTLVFRPSGSAPAPIPAGDELSALELEQSAIVASLATVHPRRAERASAP